jgi:hypothetical protein
LAAGAATGAFGRVPSFVRGVSATAIGRRINRSMSRK